MPLSHLGYTIPPQADCGWIWREAGPGPAYGDEKDGGRVALGSTTNLRQRNTTIMTWNLLHLARMLKSAGWLPSIRAMIETPGKRGARFAFENPEYRSRKQPFEFVHWRKALLSANGHLDALKMLRSARMSAMTGRTAASRSGVQSPQRAVHVDRHEGRIADIRCAPQTKSGQLEESGRSGHRLVFFCRANGG